MTEKRISETGKKLSEILKIRKVTQQELAKRIGKSQGFLSKILNGEAGASEETIENILGVMMLTEDEKFELWKAWSFDRAEKNIMEYYKKLEEENKKLKKILKDIKEIS
ncbi:MAG: helix-turn-helix domain-containing protein [Cetobacterium sp.]